MKINLIDPGLMHQARHHFDWDRKLARHLLAAGHEVPIYAHARANDAIANALTPLAPFHRLFRVDPYTDPQPADPIAGEAIHYFHHGRLIAEDLRRIAQADLCLWPSLFAPQLLGSAP